MEQVDRLVDSFASGDFDSFIAGAMDLLEAPPASQSFVTEKLHASMLDFSAYHLRVAFGPESNSHSRSRSGTVLSEIFQQIPRRLVACDIRLVQILLVPVRELMDTEFSDVVKSHEQLKRFYEDVDIFKQWFKMDPRMWHTVGDCYRILDQMIQAIQEEVETIAIDPEAAGRSGTPIRNRLNSHLRAIRDRTLQGDVSLSAFTQLFPDLVELYDLVDLELFLETYPQELYLKSANHGYKTSFARKIALTAVKKWVRAHQVYKKLRDVVSRKAIPPREDVIRACIHAHLDITSDSDSDCRVFWSHVRKNWLSAIYKSGRLNVHEILDHIQDDPNLMNQLFIHLQDENQTEYQADLLLASEELRLSARRTMQLDDPKLLMLMSLMQTGRRECWTNVFGPVTDKAFILPFGISRELDPNLSVHEVVIVDNLSLLDSVSRFFAGASTIVVVDVFYKVFHSMRFERPVPSVVSLATETKVFILMTSRMTKNSPVSAFAMRSFFRIFFASENILKIVSGTKCSEKAFALWTLVADDPFDPSTCQRPAAATHLRPFLDLTDVYLNKSFSSLVFDLLGGLRFCDFEEYSDWSRADFQFLRDSQLHYIASRAWLGLQLFHTIEANDASGITGRLSSINFAQAFGINFYTAWAAPEGWLSQRLHKNRENLNAARNMVVESQERMRAELKSDLMTPDEEATRFGAEFDITE